MKARLLTAVTSCALIGIAGHAAAADKAFDFGKREFEANCASCHGVKAKGDGPLKPYLNRISPDLTVLARDAGGVFPMDRVLRAIDGRDIVGPHGTRDMPVWGDEYIARARADYMDTPYASNDYVRTRLLALADYLNRMQVK